LLVLDESTAYLPHDGVERLFETIRSVAASGTGVLLVTHRLEEVQEIADRVTVLRDGERVATALTVSLSDSQLLQLILGFSLEEQHPERERTTGEVIFEAADVAGSGVETFHVRIRAGEIVGVTGLLGMGWEDVPYLLFGAVPATAGWFAIRGRRQSLAGLRPRRAIECGMALVPANRLRDGGLADASVRENLTLTTLGEYFFRGLLRSGRERERVAAVVEAFDVRPPDAGRALGTLSGGNQQKVIVGKWFETRPSVLLLHEPVRGVDVGARAQIFRVIEEAAAAGAGVLIATAEYEDLVHLCDRVVVFGNGRVVSELRAGNLSLERIGQEALSGSASSSG
jgi:ribose transport system ATP-binding protein